MEASSRSSEPSLLEKGLGSIPQLLTDGDQIAAIAFTPCAAGGFAAALQLVINRPLAALGVACAGLAATAVILLGIVIVRSVFPGYGENP
jgi:hypothetical protein